MPSRLGPIDIDCDAPNYPIVKACERLGMYCPEDVRWCRMSHYLSALIGWKGLFNRHTWKMLWETRARARARLLGRIEPVVKYCWRNWR